MFACTIASEKSNKALQSEMGTREGLYAVGLYLQRRKPGLQRCLPACLYVLALLVDSSSRFMKCLLYEPLKRKHGQELWSDFCMIDGFIAPPPSKHSVGL